jgi:Phasin protein
MAQSGANGNVTELFDNFNQASRRWLGCVEAEAKLNSELAAKLTQARSFPEVMAAYQEWGTRQLEMISGEAKHFLDDAQKLAQSGAHVALTNWSSNGRGIST